MSKKSYETPKLEIHGDITQLTQATGGGALDVVISGGGGEVTTTPGSGVEIRP
jgi:hypothetical protein